MSFYYIKKGKHRPSGIRVGFCFWKKKLCTEVSFMDDCLYVLNENYDQINKLFGVSTSWLPFFKKGFNPPHHKNSIRFGWRCIDGENIEILSYAYINKERRYKVLGKCKPGEILRLCLEIDNNDYLLKMVNFNGSSGLDRIPSGKKIKRFFGYRLFPYFGGKIKAPHNITISLKDIEKII